MCGILGGNIAGWDYEKGIERICHRGPDGRRILKYDDCTLGFVRLAIMDLSEKAMQPFVSEDGNIIVLFNGEIYGFHSLRNILKQKYPFRTSSDTEVILYAYMEYGNRFIDYIDGMFAIVIYDKRAGQLKLYRDRYGIKPLYYLYENHKFAFTSELKAFVAAGENGGDFRFRIDKTAVYDYLVYQYIPEPKSMYQHIYKLEPATCIHYDVRKKRIVRKEKYWNLKVCLKAHGNKKRADVLDDIKMLIRNSVQKQMVADVPVGTFLSGGVDSSIISYECSRINPDVKSFSIGFENKDFDESRYAETVADVCHIKNVVSILSNQEISAVRGMLQELYDEPFADTSAYPTYIVSALARKNVKVVLTGDGGDELFGGYERYRWLINERKGKPVSGDWAERFLDKTRILDGQLKTLWRKTFESDLTTYTRIMGFFDKSMYASWRKKLDIDREYDNKWFLRKYYHKEMPAMTRMRYLDFKTYLPGDVLTKVDRTAMHVSLEARIPFLDRELVEYMFSLAEDEYFYDNELKTLLKKAYEDVLPGEILYRKKKGFAIPAKYVASGNNTVYERILKLEWKQLCDAVL